MATNTRRLFYFLLGMCLVTSLLAAATYQEPDIEANTIEMMRAADEGDGSGGDNDGSADDDDGSGDNDDSSGYAEEGSGDEDDGDISGDTKSGKDDMMKKLNGVEEDEAFSGTSEFSSSEEERGPGSGDGGGGKKDCKVTKALKTMTEYLQVLGKEIDDLKKQVADSCSSGGKMPSTSMEDGSEEVDGSGSEGDKDMEGSGDDQDKGRKDCGDESDEGSTSDEDQATTAEPMTTTPEPTLPPPPTWCPSPFQLLASSCYYIQTDSREWRSFGEAMAFCTQQKGSLAAPYRLEDLSDYLERSYSNTLWVGGRFDGSSWVWMDGRPIPKGSWKQGKPSNHPAKRCMYLDAWNNYKGVNHYCGEKFSFVCEYKEE